jgi:hypothetical protein
MPQFAGMTDRPSTPGLCRGGKCPLDFQSPWWSGATALHRCLGEPCSGRRQLQAAQRKISAVVPVKLPLIRGAIHLFAWDLSPEKKLLLTWCPVARLYRRLTPLFSFIGLARTHLAHCAPVGSFVPGGTVWK